MKLKSHITASVLLALTVSCSPAFSNSVQSKSSNDNGIEKIEKNKRSENIATDGFINNGAWDWSNWQDVVSECKIFVFRKRMISSK